MDKNKIDRINELAHKKVLTDDEKEEQKRLRQEYIDAVMGNLKRELDNTYVVDENGNKKKIQQKSESKKSYK